LKYAKQALGATVNETQEIHAIVAEQTKAMIKGPFRGMLAKMKIVKRTTVKTMTRIKHRVR